MPSPSPRWCYSALGLEAGAGQAEVRRAYLQRARETHPDKGGSAETFRKVVDAFELLTGEDVEEEEEEELDLKERAPGQRFTLKEVSQLAAQVRALNRDRRIAEHEARCGRREE